MIFTSAQHAELNSNGQAVYSLYADNELVLNRAPINEVQQYVLGRILADDIYRSTSNGITTITTGSDFIRAHATPSTPTVSASSVISLDHMSAGMIIGINIDLEDL